MYEFQLAECDARAENKIMNLEEKVEMLETNVERIKGWGREWKMPVRTEEEDGVVRDKWRGYTDGMRGSGICVFRHRISTWNHLLWNFGIQFLLRRWWRRRRWSMRMFSSERCRKRYVGLRKRFNGLWERLIRAKPLLKDSRSRRILGMK